MVKLDASINVKLSDDIGGESGASSNCQDYRLAEGQNDVLLMEYEDCGQKSCDDSVCAL